MSVDPQLTSPYDGVNVKQTLDDLVVAVVADTYKEDMKNLWLSSSLGVASIAIACWGQFMVPFPQQSSVLAVLVTINILLAVAISLSGYFEPRGLLFKSTPSKFRPNAIYVITELERFATDYTFTASLVGSPKKSVTWVKPIAQFIRADGSVCKDNFDNCVRSALKTLESGANN